MDRRKFLASTGAVFATTALAGCEVNLGSGGSDDSTETSDGSGTPTADNSTPQPTPEPTPEPTPTPSSDSDSASDTVSIAHSDYYHAIPLGYDTQFTLTWTVTNELSSDLDFDVFLLTESEFQVYDGIVQGDNRQFQYIPEGTVQGVRESASEAVALEGGTYYLVIDNTDLGDAGDIGEQSTRQVSYSVEVERQ